MVELASPPVLVVNRRPVEIGSRSLFLWRKKAQGGVLCRPYVCPGRTTKTTQPHPPAQIRDAVVWSAVVYRPACGPEESGKRCISEIGAGTRTKSQTACHVSMWRAVCVRVHLKPCSLSFRHHRILTTFPMVRVLGDNGFQPRLFPFLFFLFFQYLCIATKYSACPIYHL